MNFKKGLSLILAAALMSGCSTVSTSSDYVRGTNFSNLKTYDWVSELQPVSGDIRVDNKLVDSRIRKAVENTLAAKGFVKSTSGKPDFLVSYHAAIEGKLDVTTLSTPYQTPSTRDILNGSFNSGVLAYGGSQTFVSQYEEGSVFIDIVDPKSNSLIWRGTGKATVLEKATPEKREARINEGVSEILSEFPPT